MNIADEVQRVVEALEAAGIRAVVDVRDANPPCVQIAPPALTYRFGGCAEMEFAARVMVPDSGASSVLTSIGPYLDTVVSALGGAPTRADPETWLLPDGSTVPGYNIVWTHRNRNGV